MTTEPPTQSPSRLPPTGNKLGALSIAIVCVLVSVGIYYFFNPTSIGTAQCISRGGASTRCGLPSGAAGAIGVILFFGFAAAGRTWKGR